jgi:hypothetical protein
MKDKISETNVVTHRIHCPVRRKARCHARPDRVCVCYDPSRSLPRRCPLRRGAILIVRGRA